MRVPKELTNSWIDPKFMARFLRAPFDERRGVLRMLHAAHEGLDQGDLMVVPSGVALSNAFGYLNDIGAGPDVPSEPPTDMDAAYSALEAQAEVQQ